MLDKKINCSLICTRTQHHKGNVIRLPIVLILFDVSHLISVDNNRRAITDTINAILKWLPLHKLKKRKYIIKEILKTYLFNEYYCIVCVLNDVFVCVFRVNLKVYKGLSMFISDISK